MHYDIVEIIGLIAAFCSTAAFMPQVIQIWRSKSAQDISLGMYSLLAVGVTSWLVYGLFIGSIAIVLNNICTLILTAIIFVLKLKYSKN